MLKDERLYPMLGAMSALFLAALDQTIIVTALPKIIKDMQAFGDMTWVMTSYMLASTVTLPIAGKLSDIYGRRLFFIGGILTFLFGSIFAGLSWSMGSLILFRVIQGIGAGAIMVNTFAVVADLFTPLERGKWQGLIGSVFGLSSILGPLLGGWLTQAFSWRWIFYINVPIGLGAFALIWFTLPHRAHRREKCPIDYLGAFFLASTLLPLLLALMWGGTKYAWSSSLILSLFSFSLLAFLAFVWVENRAQDPILPLWLFKHRTFVVSVIVLFLVMMAMFGAILFIPLFAQGVIDYSPMHAGLMLTPMTLAVVFASTIAGQLISRTGRYRTLTIAGIMVIALSSMGLTQLSPQTTHLELILKMIMMGLGIGVTMPVFNLVVQSAFPKHLGVVTSSLQLARSIGGCLGTAFLGGFLNSAMLANLTKLKDEPFMQYLAGQPFGLKELHNFLTPDSKETLYALLAQLPAPAKELLPHFLMSLRQAFSLALVETYSISTIIIAFALVAVFFLPEIPLHHRAEEEVKLADNLNLVGPEL